MALASRSRIVSSILTAVALTSSMACSVILNPRDDVQRCGNSDDCDAPTDNRFEAVCVSDENADIDTTVVEQICVAEFRSISCDPMGYDATHPLRLAVAERSSSDYACADFEGSRGCPPEAGVGCMSGLELNEFGTCDVPGAEVPSIYHSNSMWDVDAQDVKDQFCRGYFCDESFVCNTETNSCQECDPSLPFGQGGCGEVYTQGVPSCVYVSPDDVCDAPDSDIDTPIFGDCLGL